MRVEHHATVNETVLYGMGELHLRVMLERMTRALRRAGQDPSAEHPVSRDHHAARRRPLPAQEADRRRGPVRRGVPALEALQRGAGFEFVDEVVGGAIPGQFIPAVEKGVRQVLDEGAIAGFPLQDVRVTVYDGKHHAVDSKEVAFVSAGRKAFLDAIAKAQPDRAGADRARRDHRARQLDRRHHRRSRHQARPASTATTRCRAVAPPISALVPLAELTSTSRA